MEGATHEVAVADTQGQLLEKPRVVAAAELEQTVVNLKTAHPHAIVWVDGTPINVRPPANLPEAARAPMSITPDDPHGTRAATQLSQTILWTGLDRAVNLQTWMLQQASAFTHDLLEQNRKLADQAADLQARFQASMQRIDLMETEKKLIEHDLMARRLSRHAIAQNRAEEEAARPPPPPGQPWIDELIAGVSAFLGAQRQPPKDWPRN